MGALLMTGCASVASGSPSSEKSQLTAKACKDIVSIMIDRIGNHQVQFEGPSQSPFQRMVVAIRNSPNAKLRSELAPFYADLASFSSEVATRDSTSGTYTIEANAMVKTCNQLGFNASTW